MSAQSFNVSTLRRSSHSSSWLGRALVALVLSLAACVGRVEMSSSSPTITYGRVGERVFLVVGTNSGLIPAGSQDATYQNIKVKVGSVEALVVDVVSVTSTLLGGGTARVVLFEIPNQFPGRYPITILQNGHPLESFGEFFVMVLPE